LATACSRARASSLKISTSTRCALPHAAFLQTPTASSHVPLSSWLVKGSPPVRASKRQARRRCSTRKRQRTGTWQRYMTRFKYLPRGPKGPPLPRCTPARALFFLIILVDFHRSVTAARTLRPPLLLSAHAIAVIVSSKLWHQASVYGENSFLKK